jgi:hypothetical protein
MTQCAEELPPVTDAPPAEAAALPDLRLARIVVAPRGSDPNEALPAAAAIDLRVLTDTLDLGIMDQAAAAARAPLAELRDALRQGEPFKKAEQLGRQLSEARQAAAEAEEAGRHHLAAASEALRDGKDPKKHESAYRAAMADSAVQANRSKALAGLHVNAQRDAHRGLEEALESERRRLYAAAVQRDADLAKALLAALAPLLPAILAAKSAKAALTEDGRLVSIRGENGIARRVAAGDARLPVLPTHMQ